ncbi:glycosyltransferase [Candidatus Woesearchaeota archaeon]|nr:glycosyltransferase [Candidatus Woesearchaeota archaeon]
MKVSVILPTYNERGNIVELCEELIKEIKKAKFEPEIVVVDDSSPDGTAEEAKKARGVKVIARAEKGLATAVLRGIRESSGEIIAVMDADFSHPPAFVPALLKQMKEADAVFASRYIKGGKMQMDLLQYTFSKMFNYGIKFMLGIPVLDSTGGFFAIRRAVVAKLPDRIFYGYGDYCFRLIYAIKKSRIKEIPFSYQTRRYGKSKTPVLRTAVKYGIEALKLRLR